MQKKLLLFDFDGTIANSLPVIKEITNILAEKHHFKKVTDKEIEILRSKGPKEIMKILGISWWRIPFIGRDLKKEVNKIIKDIPAYPGTKELFKVLKSSGYTIVILTSNSKQNVQAFLKHNEIDQFVHEICGDVGVFGKAKKIEQAIKKEGFKKEDVFYIGDEVRDIEASKKVGIKIISVSWGFNTYGKLKSMNPDFLIKKPDEISAIVMI